MVRSRIAVATLALALLASPAAANTGVPAQRERGSGNLFAAALPPLSPRAERIAKVIRVLPSVQRLRILGARCHQAGCMSIEQLALHQQVTEAVVIASLEVDRVLAKIDDERAEIMELRQRLTSRLNHKTDFLSMANIVTGTGSGIIGTAMQLDNRTAIPGDLVGVAGGVVGVFFSVLGLKTHAGTGSLGVGPSMLAPLLRSKASGHSAYPHDVWAYLNTPLVSHSRVHASWREELVNDWVNERRISRPNTPNSQKKIDHLTGRITNRKRMSLRLLADRSIMLLELSARVSLMTGDLSDLMKAIAIPLSPQAAWVPEISSPNPTNSSAATHAPPRR